MSNKIIIYKVEKSYGTFYKETVVTPEGKEVEISHSRLCTPDQCRMNCPGSDFRMYAKYLTKEMLSEIDEQIGISEDV